MGAVLERFPVIAALDPQPGSDPARWVSSTVKKLAGSVAGCKLGPSALLPLSLREVRMLTDEARSLGCPLLVADLKVADVPHTSRRMARYAAEAGFDVVIAHAFPGPDVVREVTMEGVNVWLVAALSNRGARVTMDQHIPFFVRVAGEAGVDGLVLPATEPSLVRLARRLGWERVIASPGIGAQGARPCSAIESGATYEIVGRSLILNSEPKAWLEANYSQCAGYASGKA